MTLPRPPLALVLVAAAACNSSHGSGDEPALEPDGLGRLGTGSAGDAGAADGGAPAAAGQGSADAAGDAAFEPAPTDALQVWIGKTRGPLWTCDDPPPWSELMREYRTVLLLWLGPDGAARGATVAFGEGAPPPPAEDPGAIPGADAPWESPTCATGALVEGFDYPGHDVRLQDGRFQLTFYRNDFYASWCALQPSFSASEAAQQAWGRDYYCRDTASVVDESSANFLEAGGDAAEELCVGNFGVACSCDAASCGVLHRWPLALDLVVEGERMEGWLVDAANPSQMRLQRER